MWTRKGTLITGFIDHHPLPAERTMWSYFVHYISRHGQPRVGVQSVCNVAMQAMQ